MPVVVAFLLYAGHVLRRPVDVRLKLRRAGPALLLAGAAGTAAAWVGLRPPGMTGTYFTGELVGVLAVYAMSCSLVLATRARWLERWFGGLDRMYLWHKRCAVVGTSLLLPHAVLLTQASTAVTVPTRTHALGQALGIASFFGILAMVVVSLPQAAQILRLPYSRWLLVHRLIGLWVLLALVHGLLLDRIVAASFPLMALYLLIGGTGMTAYVFEEVMMRRHAPSTDYVVERVDRHAADVLDLHLAPVGDGVAVRVGQFMFLRTGSDHALRRPHPFSVSHVSPDGRLRMTIRSLGRDTARMHARLVPGLPEMVSGPYGMFDYTLGGHHQVWIAGGIGIAPFLSWLGALDPNDAYQIDLFYSTPTEADAVYLSELHSAEERLAPLLTVQPVFTRAVGHLTGDKVAAASNFTRDSHVFLCGPAPLVKDLSRDLRRVGIPADHIHSEHLAFQ